MKKIIYNKIIIFNNKGVEMWGKIQKIEKLMLFATPSFLFISSFLMFFSYRENVPAGFWKNRIKFIFIPYIIWSLLYTLILSLLYRNTWPTLEKIILNILTGQFHIYFILIVGQFYLIFILFQRIKQREKFLQLPALILIFLFNFIYLFIFTYYSSPYDILDLLWKRYYLFFPAWIFYFFLGGYLAYNFERFKNWLRKNGNLINIITILTIIFTLITVNRPVTSKRPEILIFATGMILYLFHFTYKLEKEIPFITLISRFSFGIYLSHPLFYNLLHQYYLGVHPWLFFGISLGLQLGGGLILTYLISSIPGGQYVVGKIQKSNRKTSTSIDKSIKVDNWLQNISNL